jgi:hypothetical protein
MFSVIDLTQITILLNDVSPTWDIYPSYAITFHYRTGAKEKTGGTEVTTTAPDISVRTPISVNISCPLG